MLFRILMAVNMAVYGATGLLLAAAKAAEQDLWGCAKNVFIVVLWVGISWALIYPRKGNSDEQR